ncbi:protein kinase [Myxococcus faecalis]|uniref:serine/threonine protein kinase n=1 Tax=Myxococcus faecalis TaxID=3115646 RepID=UPI003CE97266
MREDDEAELRAVLLEGLLADDEVESLRAAVEREQKGPLDLLHARGRLSEATLASLRSASRAALQEALVGPPTVQVGAPRPLEPEALEAEPPFPVPGWERYAPIRFLGQGGMGRVFLVQDLVLRRLVALKFVKDDEPGRVRHFVAEAQAQARVEHERVCKVYEVGQVQGRAYIAMQYVDGLPLHQVASQLSVEQKALLLAQAAEGVHAAHRAGLIHRDIKPSNILVERTADGQWKPYVLDFGLARAPGEGVTATGAILGTPHYMAPEQARGEVSQLDRRVDVYALGATLYALLVGQAPVPGSNALEVLSRIPTEEPRPPRALAPEVPADLEAIVLKCLEKERGGRYDSARALVEDLRRFLDGAPVLARSTGPGYRMARLARRYWRGLTLAAVVGLVLLLAGVQAVLARREADVREHLARRFSELAEHVEARARYTALARLHDTREERRTLEARLEDIAREMRAGGERALGPGNEALGRGWLAMGEPGRAKEALEAAWHHGTRTPRVACALALALGQLYQEQLRASEHLPAMERQGRRKALVAQYREPALEWLRKGGDVDLPPAEYVAALLAYHEERYADALERLDALGERLPWFFEAPLLRGDVLVARATSHWDAGRRESAQEDLDAARRAHARAASLAESLPEAHLALAGVEQVALRMGLYGQGDVTPHLERALEALERGLTASPRHVPSLVRKAMLHRRLAEYRGRQGGDVRAPLEAALKAARAALEVEPNRSEARQALGLVLWQEARLRQARSEDPRALLRQSIEAFEGVAPRERGYDYHANLGLIFKVWADHEDAVGEDSLGNRQRAIEAYRTAIGIDESLPDAWINLGSAWFKRASNPRSTTADEDLERAREALEKARSLNPRNLVSHFYEAQVHALRAARARDSGKDARSALDAALGSYRSALALNAEVPQLHGGVGLVHLERARDAWQRGESPFPAVDEAREAFVRARALAPKQGLTYSNLSEALAARAAYRLELGEDPREDAQAAKREAQAALALQPELSTAWANLGHAELLLATYAWERGLGFSHARVAPLRDVVTRAPRDASAVNHAREDAVQGAATRAPREAPAVNHAREDALQSAATRAPREASAVNHAREDAVQGAATRAPRDEHAANHPGEDAVQGAATRAPRDEHAANHSPEAAARDAAQRNPRDALEVVHPLEAAELALREAVTRNPRDEEALRYVAKARRLRALVWRGTRGTAPLIASPPPSGLPREQEAVFTEAAQAHEAVLALSARPHDDRLALARLLMDHALARHLADASPGDALERGRAHASAVLKVRPDDLEARALHAALELLRVRSSPTQPLDEQARAREALSRALVARPRLGRTWVPLLTTSPR